MRTDCCLLLTFVFAGLAFAEESAQVSRAEKPVPQKIAAEQRAVLSDSGFSVRQGDEEIAHVWIRAVVPTSSTKEPIPYYKLKEGTLVGAIELAGEAIHDFRGQPLPGGLYTIRMVLQPEDGNHMGVAAYPEFVCLLRADQDVELAPLFHDELLEKGSETLDSGHPAVLFLEPIAADSKGPFPAITKNRDGHVVLQLPTKATLADGSEVEFTIGIIIIGVSDAA